MFIFVFPASGRGPGTVQLHRVKQLINGMCGSTKDLWQFIGNIYNKIAKYRHIRREKTSQKRPSGPNLQTVGPQRHFNLVMHLLLSIMVSKTKWTITLLLVYKGTLIGKVHLHLQNYLWGCQTHRTAVIFFLFPHLTSMDSIIKKCYTCMLLITTAHALSS